MITEKTLNEWKSYKGTGMTSALGEYTPEEFWDAIAEIERLTKERDELQWKLNLETDYIGNECLKS